MVQEKNEDQKLKIRAVEPTRLYQQVAQQIESLIFGGEFPTGTRLPAERALISMLGVSRSVLREALIVLELKGLVEIRVGSGTFVRESQPGNTAEYYDASLLDEATAFDLLSGRKIIECEVARLAALSRTPEDLARMSSALEQMKQDIEPYMLRHVADRTFHMSIAEATRNPVFVFTVATYWDRYRRLIIDRGSALARRPENRDSAVADHEMIYRCIADRDGEGAAAAMGKHLERVSWFLSSFNQLDD